ncbi:membrane protein [Photobacterium iliopiscarium]|jgi:modulator of FtsH protease|uniref:BAX inhibitor (BI)-1/YccA family protein n=1 Tax=Photobacterium iliopiscarium TaxID=56192 RepID=A0A0D8P5U6_9GAMM|nr:Bax inhibitor-1/YccA family protein [Photobacterium iliopiscarium]KJG14143.1 membrane protein [Photobacterium iliopiscarium]KJG24120.1 membrane protein [Photobacterium iliopiscarium]MCD9468686.1 BAX inhibitor (BI)-1/YccA family protein [Photobacterium iliopiscarium]MCD9488813.1 FtsH protease modulator YccA [Photobacterium iliopiscarium]MCF2245555.1 FtsH protease modulator YccA [Photobacterium iliopiscarium]
MNERMVNRDNGYEGVLSTNKVLRNTYFLLSLTLLFSAAVAGVAMVMNVPPVHWIILLVGFYGLIFLTERNRDSSLGIMFVFALTGFMGYTLGPILNMYVGAGMGHVVMTALGGTALTFFACSAYALTTKRDLSFLNGMLMAGFIAIIVAVVANIFLKMPMLSLAISGMFVLFSSAAILLTTQSIIRGGETNYISATVTLYVSIYNLFLSLLQILGVVNSSDN